MATICAGRLRQAIQQYPESNAVLVRRHGLYVWGKDWIQAKTQAECYDYLFEAALRMRSLGIDASLPQSPAPLQPRLANGHATASTSLAWRHADGSWSKSAHGNGLQGCIALCLACCDVSQLQLPESLRRTRLIL